MERHPAHDGVVEGQEMITEKTAEQIYRRTQLLARINYCLENMDNLRTAELELTFRADNSDGAEGETFTFSAARVTALLREIKAENEAELDELNTLAVQEAQDQEAGNEQ